MTRYRNFTDKGSWRILYDNGSILFQEWMGISSNISIYRDLFMLSKTTEGRIPNLEVIYHHLNKVGIKYKIGGKIRKFWKGMDIK